MTGAAPPIRVLLLSKYARRGASSRLRFLQFLPGLAEAGIAVEAAPFFSEGYLEARYAGRRAPAGAAAGAYLRRLAALFRAGRYDLVWIEGELFPYLPAWAERVLALFGVRMVADYDDAIFHRYDLARNPLVRLLLGRKIAAVMRRAAVVTVGNGYLADYAARAGAPRIVQIPTVVDAARYRSAAAANAAPVVGWIGTPVTSAYVRAIAGPLQQACRAAGARLRLVGIGAAGGAAFDPGLAEIVAWTEEGEGETLASIDIGIMPLEATPWEQGKCGYKLIQYMASGAPVIASRTAANEAIVERGRCGLIVEAGSDRGADWQAALASLLADPDRMARMGRAGRKAVEEHYSVAAQLPRLVEILRSAARPGRARAARGGAACAE